MKPDFSEFSYGFAVTDELINWYGTNLTAAPIFPSLLVEGKGGGGYDVLLNRRGIPLFLQFKCTRLMKGRNALGFKSGCFRSPYYRMDLRSTRYSDQHPMLLEWEKKGNEVYYVAPAFHLLGELNDAYLAKQVCEFSIWFRPSTIGKLPDRKEHHVGFQRTGKAYLFSEPHRLQEALDNQTFIEHLLVRLHQDYNRLISFEFLQEIADELNTMIQQKLDQRGIYRPLRLEHREDTRRLVDLRQQLSPFERIAYLARTFLDSAFFIVTEKQ